MAKSTKETITISQPHMSIGNDNDRRMIYPISIGPISETLIDM